MKRLYLKKAPSSPGPGLGLGLGPGLGLGLGPGAGMMTYSIGIPRCPKGPRALLFGVPWGTFWVPLGQLLPRPLDFSFSPFFGFEESQEDSPFWSFGCPFFASFGAVGCQLGPKWSQICFMIHVQSRLDSVTRKGAPR